MYRTTLWYVILALLVLAATTAFADTLDLSLTSTRTQFTVAEPVELSVVYKNDGGNLKRVPVEVRQQDGSALTVQVAVEAAPGKAQATLFALKPGALKPGQYTASIAMADAKAKPVSFAVHQDFNPNAYFIGTWMQGNADWQTALMKGGWMYFSSDLINASVRQPKPGDLVEEYIAGRMKPFSMAVMGGGHQLDLQLINDWGDPWVQRAVIWKMSLATLSNRIYPMAGMHAFDEPGLTWWPVKEGTQPNAWCIPAHLEEFKKLTGKEMPYGAYEETMPMYKPRVNDFMDFVEMRLKYLQQAWYGSVWGVDVVNPNFTTINQMAASYSPGNVTDGVDTRMDAPYRVLSGHGGYSDWAGSWGAVISAESNHGWSWDKPHYYLPMWNVFDYPQMRQETFLPWSVKLEGMEYDPNHDWSLAGGNYVDENCMFEIAENNRRMAMVGDVMSRMPRALAPVATLLSHRQYAFDLAGANYPKIPEGNGGQYASQHRDKVNEVVRRIMSCGIMPNWLDEGEVSAKGADFLKQWKVVYCPGLTVASPTFRKAIEGYIAAGGKFVQDKKDELKFTGAVLVDYNFTEANPPAISTDWGQREHALQLTPTFAADLKKLLGPQMFTSNAPADTMLMSVQRCGTATYLLMGNNTQDPTNTRQRQMDPIPLDTTINVPATGVIYDLLNGGTVSARFVAYRGDDPTTIQAPLHLAAGDGACWLHLPAAPGAMKLGVRPLDNALQIDLEWGTAGYLPFRMRIFDPAGNKIDDLYRATTPVVLKKRAVTNFTMRYPLGANAAPGKYTVEISEWLTGSKVSGTATVKPAAQAALAQATAGPVSVYFDDAKKIADLFAGKAVMPPLDKMHWDLLRTFGGLDAKKFAVIGPDAQATQIANALRAKGMTVEVNPKFEIKPFTREPNHGGTGPVQDQWSANFENIYAHAIVLAGNTTGDKPWETLGKHSWERGHINRPITATFPGPGRSYIQWGIGGYQAGFQDVWAFGDLDIATQWLLNAIAGKTDLPTAQVTAAVKTTPAAPVISATRFNVKQEIKAGDTPVGVGSSPDGKTTFVLQAGGTAMAYDATGKMLWSSPVLLQGGALAVSPKGDRIAVGGFPGLFVLDAATGKILGGSKAAALVSPQQTYGASRILCVAWNSAGTIAAGGWFNNTYAWEDTIKKLPKPAWPTLDFAVVDANGSVLPAPQGITDSVYGVAFVPNTDTLLIGTNQLIAVNAKTGARLWSNGISGAMAFAFSADGKTAAAGGWGKNAGRFNLADGNMTLTASFDSHVGGVALLPNGDVVAAVWGGTRPLSVIRDATKKAEPFFQSTYAFQNVCWSPAAHALVAAEEGGRLWLLGADGKPLSLLSDDAGTTAYRMELSGNDLLLGRMNRTAQHVTVASAM